ncbi:MAG: hypothetical protein RLP44_11650 [Aggregatilineales bacterium]
MSSLYDRIVSQRGSLERLVARIPGFKGYQDKQARRTADRMIREHITGILAQKITKLIDIEKIILSSAGIAYMSKTRDVKSKLQLYHDKVATAAPKYDGMWAQMKIESEDLEKIYSFDEAQMHYVDNIDASLDKLRQAALTNTDLDAAIFETSGVVTEALEAFDLRDNVLTELGDAI